MTSAARVPNRPAAVAFDVVETLMALEPMGVRFESVGLPAHAVREWFPRILLYGLGLDASGIYTSFPVTAAAALRTVARHTLTPDQVAYVLAGMNELPAHPDVEPAMRALSEGGVRVSCLTNGAPEVTLAFLERSGLAAYVEQVITTSEVASWKPPARVYHHACAKLGLPPEAVALVAAHAWDCHGAKRAGLTAGWVSRLEGGYDEIFDPADVLGDTLDSVAHGLLALPAHRFS